ncbi:MAG TPA: hypothetical protein VKN99_02705 [Polyangia bacterium]|nr:hypothetical protein [Polyangia bacterium]
MGRLRERLAGKLRLRTETLRNLTPSQLGRVAGGTDDGGWGDLEDELEGPNAMFPDPQWDDTWFRGGPSEWDPTVYQSGTRPGYQGSWV